MYVYTVIKIGIVTVHLPRDWVKFCVLLKVFVWASWDSDMKIAYKIRNECFLLARKKICHFSTLDIPPSTLDILPSTLDKNLH